MYPDTRENERLNSLLKLMTKRAPNISLLLLAARFVLKSMLGHALEQRGNKFKAIVPRAEQVKELLTTTLRDTDRPTVHTLPLQDGIYLRQPNILIPIADEFDHNLPCLMDGPDGQSSVDEDVEESLSKQPRYIARYSAAEAVDITTFVSSQEDSSEYRRNYPIETSRTSLDDDTVHHLVQTIP